MEDVLRSGPFTSVNGDRAYLNKFFIDYFATFIGDGIFPVPSNNLQVMANSGLGITVKKGTAFINGRVHLADTDINLTLDAGDNLLSRIDKVVLRVDTIARTITKEIEKGTPATNPVAPTLQRDDDIWELGLAQILVGKAVTSITQSNITDLRLNKAECGIVKGTIEEIDTTTLFNEYQAWIDEKKTEYNADLINYTTDKKAEWEDWFNVTSEDLELAWNSWFTTTSNQLEQDFNIWFQGIKDILDGDTAGNLLNKINDIPLILSGVTEPINIRTGDTWFREVE